MVDVARKDSPQAVSRLFIGCYAAVAKATRHCLLPALAVICGSILWFAMLGARSLFDPDEGRYAEIPREMLRSGDWLIPHLDGLVYFEKPPLQYWLTALSYKILGESEFAARLCTGIAGFASLLIVFFLGRRLWGNKAGGAALLLTSASVLFVLLGHQLTLDMLLSFFLTAALACFLLAQTQRALPVRRRSWMLLCWAAMGFAVLTKGLVGVVIPILTAAVYGFWQRDRKLLTSLEFGWGVLLFTVIAAPWFLLADRTNHEFFHFFFVREHFQRFLTPIEHRSQPWWFFLPVLGIGIMPWTPLALRSLTQVWRAPGRAGVFEPSRVLWAWCILTVSFFSLSDSKLIPYVLPVVPALALLCADHASRARLSLGLGALLSLAAAIGVATFATGAWGSVEMRALGVAMQSGLLMVGGVMATSALVCAVLLLEERTFGALSALCGGWFLASMGLLHAATEGERLFSTKDIALLLESTVPATAPLYSVQMYDQAVPFYLKRTVALVDYRDELNFGLEQEPAAGVADLARFKDRWSKSVVAYAVMHRRTRDLLRAAGLPMRQVGESMDRVVMSRR